MVRAFRWSAVALVVTILLAACSTVEDAAALETQKSRAAAPATYLVVGQGTLASSLPAVAAANRDQVRSFYPDAGFASVVTANPNAYRRFGTVTRDITVQWIEPGKQVALDIDAANPPYSGDDDFFFDLQWGHDAVNAPEAWNAGVRGAGVTVAVLDTGFDTDHPDLAPNIGDAVSFVEGEDVAYALPDTFSHGTHTAGTIAAADNAFGTIGVAPDATLMLVKVLSDSGSGAFSWVMEGIVYAAENGADVINMSLGALLYKAGFWDEDAEGNPVFVTAREVQELRVAMERVIRYAIQQGTLVVASAGNEAIDFDHSGALITLPGSAPGVVTVGATAPIGWATDPGNVSLDYLASYSNYGRSHVDFGAPGGDYIYPGNENCVIAGLVRPCFVFDFVFSTGSNGWYWSVGTSMAAPHVAGVAALILSEHGGGGSLTPAQLEAELRARADDLGQPGNDPAYGAGRVATGY